MAAKKEQVDFKIGNFPAGVELWSFYIFVMFECQVKCLLILCSV